MLDQLPVETRAYQNHHLDSTRWSAYTPRPSDIIVSTSYKAGTTDNVKARAVEEDAKGDHRGDVFEGGSASFFFKGTNGRWQDVLTQADLTLYEDAKARVLTPDSAKWLEQGGVVPK